jgi:hypothetical protein
MACYLSILLGSSRLIPHPRWCLIRQCDFPTAGPLVRSGLLCGWLPRLAVCDLPEHPELLLRLLPSELLLSLLLLLLSLLRRLLSLGLLLARRELHHLLRGHI